MSDTVVVLLLVYKSSYCRIFKRGHRRVSCPLEPVLAFSLMFLVGTIASEIAVKLDPTTIANVLN